MVAPFAHYDQTSIHGSKFTASTNARSHRKDFVTDASGMSRIEPYSRSPFTLPAGWVDPGLICSIFARARSIFLMISSTVALQMNGLGFWFQACRNASMARFSYGTLTKLPRRIAFSVYSRNKSSTVDIAGKNGQDSGVLSSLL